MRNRVHQMLERQVSNQAQTNDEVVVTQVLDQTHTKNGTELLIMRGDIASLAQEVARYLGVINSTVGTLW